MRITPLHPHLAARVEDIFASRTPAWHGIIPDGVGAA